MAQHWTSRIPRRARTMGRVFRHSPRIGDFVAEDTGYAESADSRRTRSELDAIRARFPDHA